MPSVTLQVAYEPRGHDEVVCVTGDVPNLGCWNPEGLLRMTKLADLDSRWTLTVAAENNSEIKYRYVVCSFSKHLGSGVIIHQVESNVIPRKLLIGDKAVTTEEQTFGEYGGESNIQRGWLVGTREIRLRFEEPVLSCLLNNFARPCHVKVTAIDVTVSKSEETVAVPVLAHRYSDKDCTPRLQEESGEVINNTDDIVTFCTQGVPTCHDVEFRVELLRLTSSESSTGSPKRAKTEPDLIGKCSIFSNSLTNSVGTIPLFFFNDQKLIGNIQVSYTVIEPLDEPVAHSFEVLYATHWNWKKKRTLNIGHRGMGKSHKDHSLMVDIGEDGKLVSFPENTVHSLSEAAQHGADFVEFDVHVTKDGCPVLFHDFQFSLCLPKTGGGKTHLAKLSIKDMTYEELSAVSKLTPVGAGSTDFLCTERSAFIEEELPFTKLQMALQTVPIHCGFDIEIKYPMVTTSGLSEYDGTPMDMNASVDAILNVVLKYGGDRRIFFSAFNPDVCAMIRKKQSKYPVMLCNYGPTDLYESYTDCRSITVERSIQTAKAEQIVGLCGHCEDYLANPSLVNQCHSEGLVLVCWGERSIDPEIRQRLAEIGLDGIIHDRMGTFPRDMKNTFQKEADLSNL